VDVTERSALPGQGGYDVAGLPRQGVPSEARALEELAAGAGASDLLVFRQVAPGRFLQLGGTGRGAGWAGNIELAVDSEPALERALRGSVVRWAGEAAVPVLGPYHATSAALVPVDHDVVVLLGSSTSRISEDDGVLRRVAAAATEHVGAVSPAKRLADELEVLSAVRATMQCAHEGVDEVLRHVTRSAAEALGCEIGLAWLPVQQRLVTVERGWVLNATVTSLVDAVREVSGWELPVCQQDSTRAPLPGPLGPAAGVRSHFVLPLGAPADGLLVLLHTVATPRGFTALCQDVGQKVAEAAGVVVHGAVLREDLVRLVGAAEEAARRDPLTGLANRLRWQEELDRLAEQVAVGAPAAVLVIDLNGLKAVNDEHGHDAGDAYLRAAADALRGAARDQDVVARLGGDEFGVLVPGAGPESADRLVERIRDALAAAPPVHGVALSAAIGAASCPPLRSVQAAFAAADRAMYADKIARRRT
jgi:diguanylate cyclase (GGDEF)-like protein